MYAEPVPAPHARYGSCPGMATIIAGIIGIRWLVLHPGIAQGHATGPGLSEVGANRIAFAILAGLASLARLPACAREACRALPSNGAITCRAAFNHA